MISKFQKELLKKVSTLNNNHIECFVYAKNFDECTKYFLKNNIKHKAYKFLNCFYISEPFTNLEKISDQKCVDYISLHTSVSCLVEKAKQTIDFSTLQEEKYFGQKVNIAFIDTGISPHADFLFPKNRIIKFVDLINNKTYPYDDNGHGTFVAGVCCGGGIANKKLSGFARCANIISIKALNNKGETDANIILDAMQYVYEHKNELNIKVVCMSFGAEALSNQDPLQKGALALWKEGITVVAAAGNSGPKKETIKSPGANNKIITVGAMDDRTKEKFFVAEFSSRGPSFNKYKPDLIAPGVNIISTSNLLDKNLYTTMSGTSVSTPIVAGIVATLLSKNPTLSPDKIKYFLINNCTHIDYNRNNEGFGYICFKNSK